MDYIEKLELQTEEVKEVETLEKHTIINEPISVNKYNGHTREFLAIDGDYNDGFKQLKEVDGLGISCIVSKEVKEAREDVNGVFHEKLKDRIDSEVNEIKTSLDNIETQIEEISYKSITHYKLDNDKDYTEAFRRYFADLKSGNKISLKINVPLCEVSERIILPYNCRISISGDGINTIIKYVGNSNNDVFYCKKGDLGETNSSNTYLTGEIRNLRFETNVSNVDLFKQLKGYISNFSFRDCQFSGFNYAVVFEKAYWTNIINCEFLNGVNGIKLYECNSSRLINTYFRFLSGVGIVFDSDISLSTRGSAGVSMSQLNFEQVPTAILIAKDTNMLSGNMSGCYFECIGEKNTILMEDGSSMSNFVFSGNYARYDCRAKLQNLRAVTFDSGHMSLILPNTTTPTKTSLTKNIQSLTLINCDTDFAPISNMSVHDGEILNLGFVKNNMGWQFLTSNYPFTVFRETITLSPGEEKIVANAMAQKSFRFLNYYGESIYKATIRIYKDDEIVYSVKSDIGEGNPLSPLYKEDFLSKATGFTIRIANETTSDITINNLTLSYICNMYKS